MYALKITLYSIRIKFIRYYLLFKKNDSKKYLKINVSYCLHFQVLEKKSERQQQKTTHIHHNL